MPLKLIALQVTNSGAILQLQLTSRSNRGKKRPTTKCSGFKLQGIEKFCTRLVFSQDWIRSSIRLFWATFVNLPEQFDIRHKNLTCELPFWTLFQVKMNRAQLQIFCYLEAGTTKILIVVAQRQMKNIIKWIGSGNFFTAQLSILNQNIGIRTILSCKKLIKQLIGYCNCVAIYSLT